jgi:zinc/manganese transport system permease protein
MIDTALHPLLAAAGYQSDWFETIREPFMRNAFIAGVLVALAAGVIGYFVVVRSGEFSAHALGHIGFPGATGAVLIGLSPTLGLAVFCIGGAIIIGALGRHVDERATALVDPEAIGGQTSREVNVEVAIPVYISELQVQVITRT